MRIIVDTMGGDNAPGEIVRGAVAACREFGVDIALVGIEQQVRKCLESEGVSPDDPKLAVVNATQVITMEDDPSTATRQKKDSSMTVALNMLRDGAGDALVSAGSTGALLTGATLIVKRVKGIRRAAMAPVFPNGGKGVMLIDCGANIECTAEYLMQFAFMGSFYAKNIMGCENPRIGLLNVGTEPTKGTGLQKQAHSMLTRASDDGRINFIGNVEARELFSGDVDVMVTDGFSGNIMLKCVEGTARFLIGHLKGIFKSGTKNKVAALMVRQDVSELKNMLDAGEVGGTAMLGISKPVIKAHGSSDARAIRSAIKQAVTFINADVISEIEANIEAMKVIAD